MFFLSQALLHDFIMPRNLSSEFSNIIFVIAFLCVRYLHLSKMFALLLTDLSLILYIATILPIFYYRIFLYAKYTYMQ